eukprot:TRINITY_DN60887_c1_g1_i1.p4 TRINITY_DN60887_c1_g1~~TRINITY_DN60887_c1_g1_i1.p4  ORF type:complete len:109 (-),score=14.00 TRINITY_DN60887_c1_g1_i1:79-372(-)
MEKGQRFAIREGGRTIGAGRVSDAVEQFHGGETSGECGFPPASLSVSSGSIEAFGQGGSSIGQSCGFQNRRLGVRVPPALPPILVAEGWQSGRMRRS